MKKLISLLMIFVLVISSSFVASAKSEAIDVTLSMYCNRYDADEVSGKYKDNVFYLSADTLCEMSGGKITAQDSKKINIVFDSTSRRCEIAFKNQILSEPYVEGQEIAMPCFVDNGTVYISALHFLRYFGAEVVISKDNNPQLVVYFTYDLFNAVTDYSNANYGNWFSWDEVGCNGDDIEDILVNAGIVALINRDSNIFKMALNPRGIEREALEEVLAVIVKNEGQDAFKENDVLLEEIGLVNDLLGIDLEVFDILNGAEILELPDNFDDFIDAEITLMSTAINILNAMDTMKQFENISETQKKLLRDTILTHKDDSPMLCGDWENIYKAAKNVDSRIQSDYNNTFAASCDATEKTAYSFLNGATGTPVSFAWDCLVYTGKIMASDIINKKTQLYNAYNCSMIQYVANELLVKEVERLNNGNYFYSNSSDQQACFNNIKNSLILQLKATLTTRQYLAASQNLTRTYKEQMEKMVRETALLLNKVENCKIVSVGIDSVVEEDLTWMENINTVETTEQTNIVATDSDFYELKGILKDIGDTICLTSHDSGDSGAYQKLLYSLLGPFYVSSLYNRYFGSDMNIYYSDGSNFSQSPVSKQDPLKRYLDNYCYGKIPADNVDWIIENIFNVKPSRDNADVYDDYNGRLVVYYHNDYYYFVLGDAGFLGVEPEIINTQMNTDNSYVVRYDLFMEDEYGDLYGSYETVCALKEIDGKRQWTFTSIKEAGQDFGSGISNNSNCYSEYEKIMEDYLAKWNSDEMYSYRSYVYHDIDEDGVDEMIVHDGTCEQNRTYYFYAFRDGEAILLGTVNAWHAVLYDSEKQLITCSGMGGEGEYYYIRIFGDTITQTHGGSYTFPPTPYFGETIYV